MTNEWHGDWYFTGDVETVNCPVSSSYILGDEYGEPVERKHCIRNKSLEMDSKREK